MSKKCFIYIILFVSLSAFARHDWGVGYAGRKTGTGNTVKRIESSQLKPNNSQKTNIRNHKTIEDSQYVEQYKRTLLTKEELEFAEKNKIPVTNTEQIREELSNYKKEQLLKDSIQRIETPIEERSVAWKFIADGRDYPSYNLKHRECVVAYFIPKEEKIVTDKNITFLFRHGPEPLMQIFKIEGRNNISKFSESITAIAKKMEQWIAVAQKNNITDFEKEYEGITIPNLQHNIRNVKLNARFKVSKENNKVTYVTELYYKNITSETKLSFDLIGFKNFASTTQIDKALVFLNKKISEVELHNKKQNHIDSLFE